MSRLFRITPLTEESDEYIINFDDVSVNNIDRWQNLGPVKIEIIEEVDSLLLQTNK